MPPKTRRTRTNKELRDLAVAIRSGAVLTSDQVPSDLWQSVFLPLPLMSENAQDMLIKAKPHLLVGTSPLPRQVNGYQVQGGFYFLVEEEVARLRKIMTELRDWQLGA